jgi:molecular chaperone GrpE (heat shock protein)
MDAHNADSGPEAPEDWIPDQLMTRTVAPAPDDDASFAAVVEEEKEEAAAPAAADPELERLRDELKLAEERAQRAEQAAARAEQALDNWRARGPGVDR